MKARILLTIAIWIGLPLILVCYFYAMAPREPAWVLFIFYTGFSWSVAVLAFVVETARQQLLHKTKPVRSALRLGSYGLLAVGLAIFTSPWSDVAKTIEVVLLSGLAFLYGNIMGYVYHHLGPRSGT